MPPDELSSALSEVGDVAETTLGAFNFGLLIGEALSDVNMGESLSDWNSEFSATKRSSSRISAPNNSNYIKGTNI